jgi:hypothetical protein
MPAPNTAVFASMRVRTIALSAVALALACSHKAPRSAPPRQADERPSTARTPLFNGRDLEGWTIDVPAKDTDPDLPPSFIVRDGVLVSLGKPLGHLITDRSYRDYRLVVEYRFPGAGGNCGVLIHASRPRALGGLYPQSIEVQLLHENAGDFWCIYENIEVPDMERRRPRKEGQVFSGEPYQARRILNLTDGSERPLGQWNTLIIESRGRGVKVWVNGELVNDGFNATADQGKIALQAEGTEVEFRKVELESLQSPPREAGIVSRRR